MAIRVSFLALVAGFSCILHPSASWPVCAEPHLPRSDFLESSAVTPVEDSARPPSPSIEAKSDTRDAAEDPSVWVPLDFDAWAYAFAESSRAQTVGLVGAITYDVVMNQQVKFFVDRFTTRHRDVVGLWFQRSPQYLGMIRPHFRSKGLPDELAYTAMIESGFNPRAVSRAGAKGLWQFMAGTARLYGRAWTAGSTNASTPRSPLWRRPRICATCTYGTARGASPPPPTKLAGAK